MNTPDPRPLSASSPAGEANVARLLQEAYAPEVPSDEFTQRLQARMLAVAAEMRGRAAAARPRAPSGSSHRVLRLAAVAALIGILFVGLLLLPRPSRDADGNRAHQQPDRSASQGRTREGRRPARLEGTPRFTSVHVTNRLTAAPRPASTQATAVGPGATLSTSAGQRRRVLLRDGSVLCLNQNTTVHCDAERRVTLQRGEVFVEVAPRTGRDLFTVCTTQREVKALGTKFVVRSDSSGTGVAVIQGKVQVDDGAVVAAGQYLAPAAARATAAPRASHLLAWVRDLLAAAEDSLVPSSHYAGGALVAKTADGAEANLSLRKYHVDVHIEDGFARTTIDQTYFNHLTSRLEGTFYFPLPADASLSRLAMYVDGKLMEGGMVEREYARATFEEIVRRQKDPALLEWVDGSTFKMRVFPLEGRQEKRIVLSYTQRLPALYGRLSYRFPSGHNLETVREWSFHGRVKNGAGLLWQCDSHRMQSRTDDGDLLLDARLHEAKLDRDVVLDLFDTTNQVARTEAARFSTAEQDGARYLMVRFRPDLPGALQRQRRDWVFLCESSADRDPLLARTQIEILRTLLLNAEHEDTFTVLSVGTQTRAFSSQRKAATRENIDAAVAFLEGAPLIGALDLDQGLALAAQLLAKAQNRHLVHLGSGLPALGERRTEDLLRRLPAGVRYVGVGVGKRWAREFMKRAAEASDGYFTQINPPTNRSPGAPSTCWPRSTRRVCWEQARVILAGS
jgi:hypothetical protein